jgi:hypothetical protein
MTHKHIVRWWKWLVSLSLLLLGHNGILALFSDLHGATPQRETNPTFREEFFTEALATNGGGDASRS